MEELPAPRTLSLRDHWPLLPILLLATLLRLWQINESLWLDELHSAWVVSAGLSEIATRAQIGNQSPLYFYLPWATTSLFGMSEWALRLPSLVASVALVILAYGLAFQFTRSRIAASACSILAALDHNFLFYATEARPYAWVQLIAAAQLWVFWKLQTAPTRGRRIAFVVLTVGLFYLHYTAILLVAGEIVFGLARACCDRRSSDIPRYGIRALAVDGLCMAALMIPTIVHVLDIGLRRSGWASFVNNTSLLLPVYWFSLVSYVAIPAVAGLLVGLIKAAITLHRGKPRAVNEVVGATLDGGSNASLSGSSRRSVTATFGVAGLLICWLGVPLTIVWFLTVEKIAPLYLGRYVIGAALAPVLFASLCVGVWRSSRLQLLVAGIVIASAVYSSGMIEQLQRNGRLFSDRAENWRDAVRYVNEDNVWPRDSPVFVRSGLLEADRLATDNSEALRRYCVSPVTSIYRIERTDDEIRPLATRDAGKLTDEDVKRIEASGAAWFIINGTPATRERSVERILNSLHTTTRSEIQHGHVVDERQFGYVGVYLVLLETSQTQPTSPNSIAPP